MNLKPSSRVLSEEHKKQFSQELQVIYKNAQQNLSLDDFKHLKKMQLWGRVCTLIGFATAWIIPNPLSALLISQGILSRWLLLHHISHKGYDRIPGIPAKYTSKKFALGFRRYIDWFDWMLPRAWDYEHNFLHHYYTGEDKDPDVPERNAALLRSWPLPNFLKYFILFLVACTWKFSYYSANTLNGYEEKSKNPRQPITLKNFWDLRQPLVRKLWFQCWAPYIVFHFGVVPALFLPLGEVAALSILITRLLAEVITNLHTFAIIVPNHAGDDVFRFETHYTSKEEYYYRQVIGSVNFSCGTNWNDFLHMWLNYQIEHHLFPNLPMSQYQKIQPEVKKTCEKYGVPYIQDTVWQRVGKLAAICIGTTSMPIKRYDPTCGANHISQVRP